MTILSEKTVIINPLEYTIREGDRGFFIALSAENIERMLAHSSPLSLFELEEKEILKSSNYTISMDYLTVNTHYMIDSHSSFWIDYFHILPEPKNIQDCILNKVKFENHIIVSGPFERLTDFLLPLRSKRLSKIIPVVILYPQLPDLHIWDSIGIFPDVYIVLGNLVHDLQRVNVHFASKIVILSTGKPSKRDLFRDAQSIVTARNLKNIEDIFMIVELTQPTNIRFLKNENNIEKESILLKRKWYYGGKATSLPPYHFEPHFTSGRVFVSNIFDSVFCEAFYRPYITRIIQLIITGDKPTQSSKSSSSIFQISLPSEFENKEYGILFEWLVFQHKMIPLGLYRGKNINNNPMEYVFTNPPSSTILSIEDRIFVLSQIQPIM